MAHYAFLDSNNIVTEVISEKDQGSDNTDYRVYTFTGGTGPISW